MCGPLNHFFGLEPIISSDLSIFISLIINCLTLTLHLLSDLFDAVLKLMWPINVHGRSVTRSTVTTDKYPFFCFI